MTNNSNWYEEKQQGRKEYYEAKANKATQESRSYYERSNDAVRGIPAGQPILIGHHSEKRHRKALERSDNNMRKSIEATKKAEYYADKAAAVGNGGISSDDPDAIEKLQNKLESCQNKQDYMKTVNKLVRKDDRQGLRDLGVKEALIDVYFQGDSCGRKGHASYELQNNGAEIRRLKKRIEQLERNRKMPYGEIEHDGYKVIQDPDENRIMIDFEGKPNKTAREIVKSHAFKWSRTNGVWQRKITGNAIYSTKVLIKALNELEDIY